MTLPTLSELFDSASKWTVQEVIIAQRVEPGDFVVLDKGLEHFSSLEQYKTAQWHGGPGGTSAHYVRSPGWFLTDDCVSGSLLPLTATPELQESRFSELFRMPEYLGMTGDLRLKGQTCPGVTDKPSYAEGEQIGGKLHRVLIDACYYLDDGKWYGVPATLASASCNAYGGHMQLVLPYDEEPHQAAFFETDQRYVEDGEEIELPAFTVITADRVGLMVADHLNDFLRWNAFIL